jgi:hypothetical protein
LVDYQRQVYHPFALPHPFTVKEVAELFIKEVAKLHRFLYIVSYRDPIFMSQFWNELFKKVGGSTLHQHDISPINRWSN